MTTIILMGMCVFTFLFFLCVSIYSFRKKEQKTGIIFIVASLVCVACTIGEYDIYRDSISGPTAVNKTMVFTERQEINGTDTIKTYSDTTWYVEN